MNELVVEKHDFESAKNRIQKFSQKESQEIAISKVDTDGWFFGLGSHKVTGGELNERLSTIQQHLIDLNTTNNQTIKEFSQIYKALEALDKDYIQAILVSIKGTEKTSEGLKAAQEKIKNTISNQVKILNVLTDFKEKLEKLKHLEDIDNIWNDCQKWHNEKCSLDKSIDDAMVLGENNSKEIDEIKHVVNDIEKSLYKQIERLESIVSFTEELEKMVHLHDIDDIWNSLVDAQQSLQEHLGEINEIKEDIGKQQQDIYKLLKFASLITKNKHVYEIDTLWELNESNIEQIIELKKTDDEIKNVIKSNKESVDVTIEEMIKKNESITNKLETRIKYAYIIAGSSLGLALVELLIIILKVL